MSVRPACCRPSSSPGSPRSLQTSQDIGKSRKRHPSLQSQSWHSRAILCCALGLGSLSGSSRGGCRLFRTAFGLNPGLLRCSLFVAPRSFEGCWMSRSSVSRLTGL
eukprot:6599678-Pyramimonas_sp.AAC.1